MQRALITGANRGIGLELVRQYSRDGWRVVATCRDPAVAEALRQVDPGSVEILALDVTDSASVAAAAAALDDQALDVVINNAGVAGSRGPGQQFGVIDYENWAWVLDVNLMGPMRVAEAFLPALERAPHGRLVAISSWMGSIAESSGGAHVYRSSKAALNCIVKSLAPELAGRGVVVAALHPGWVQTDMGGPSAPVTVEQSARGLRRVIDGLGPEDTGCFRDYQGQEIPW